MEETWYEGMPGEAMKSAADRAYERAEAVIRDGLARGLGFDAACAGIEVDDEDLRRAIMDDMLKVVVAEEHFAKGIALDELAGRLEVSPERLEAAKQEMFRDIEETRIRELHREGPGGE